MKKIIIFVLLLNIISNAQCIKKHDFKKTVYTYIDTLEEIRGRILEHKRCEYCSLAPIDTTNEVLIDARNELKRKIEYFDWQYEKLYEQLSIRNKKRFPETLFGFQEFISQ